MTEIQSTIRRFFKGEQITATETKRHQEFVVIGLGRFGASLAITLQDYGHEVLAIDANLELVQRMSSVLPHVVHMDATNREGFIELDVGNFSTGIICMGSNFESNILATVLLRQFGVKRVICKARTRTQREILLKVGADAVILPEHEAGVRLARKLASTGFVDYMEVNKEISVVELVPPPRLIGRSLLKSSLREKYGVVVVAIRRSEGVITLPTAQEIIRYGDILVVIGRPEDCDSIVHDH